MEENISNKNNMKNIVVGIVIFVFLIVISIRLLHIEDASPNASNKVNDTVNVNGKSAYDKMLNYMNKKYDDEFTFKSPFGGGAGADTKQMIVSSKKYPEYDIWVEYSYEDETFNDNYIDWKYKTMLEEYLKGGLENKLNATVNVKCEVSTSGSYASYNGDVAFEEYLNEEKQKNAFSAVVKNVNIDDKNKLEEQITEIFNEPKSGFFGTIYFVEDNVDFDLFLNKNVYEKAAYPNVKIKKLDDGLTKYEWK